MMGMMPAMVAVTAMAVMAVAGYGDGYADGAPLPLISYEVHSWNDLREWSQLTLKGIRFFKIDPHYMRSAFCAAYENATHAPIRGYDPRYGCLLLNHDAPTLAHGSHDAPYFSLFDIGDYPPLTLATPPSTPIKVALCLKTPDDVDPCDPGVLALLDAFFSSVSHADRDPHRYQNVEWVLDGAAVAKHACYAQRYRPYNMTFIPLSDPVDALFSDDAARGYDRYRILNVAALTPPLRAYDTLAVLDDTVHYGKFLPQKSKPASTEYNYALFWEPSDATRIAETVQFWLSSNASGGPDWGLRFAVNLDPVHWRYYAASAVHAASTALGGSASVITFHQPSPFPFASGNRNSTPTLVVLDSNRPLLLFSPQPSPSGYDIHVELYSAAPVLSPSLLDAVLVFPTKLDLPQEALVGSVVAAYAASSGRVRVSLDWQTEQVMASVVCAYDASTILHAKEASRINPLDECVVFGTNLPVDGSPMRVVALAGDDLVLTVQSEELVCVQPMQACGSLQTNITSASLVAYPPKSTSTSTSSASSTGLVVAIVATSANEVYYAFLDDSGSDTLEFVFLGYGSRVSASARTSSDEGEDDDDDDVLMVVVEDGYAWNTEVRNKQTYPRLCDMEPRSEKGVFAYGLFPLSLLSHHAASGSESETEMLWSACNAQGARVGTMGAGVGLSAAAIDRLDGRADQVWMAASARGLDERECIGALQDVGCPIRDSRVSLTLLQLF
eukprot:ANDGO_04569.mRNA.1 hypothetical protein CAOG_07474